MDAIFGEGLLLFIQLSAETDTNSSNSSLIFIDAREEALENEETPTPSERASLVDHVLPVSTTHQTIPASPHGRGRRKRNGLGEWFGALVTRRNDEYEPVASDN
jgi:hypothetical protein